MTLNTRRSFLRSASLAMAAPALRGTAQAASAASVSNVNASIFDKEKLRSLADFTALTFDTPNPNPFGAEIVETKTGKRLMRALNAVFPLHDPSAHAEVYTIRLACAELKSSSLKGYTLYTTCEPCPMCMACCLWSGLDRVVYGATIADAARFCHQILIPAATVRDRYDLPCVVDGPVEHDRCLALFTDPRMQAAFQRWKQH